jgi:5,5'-dehydrodivanillate O-demethylase oxygenase subunit
MLAEENRKITQVGPGTPGGNLLRRYWWPVMPSASVTNKPVKVGLLGQKFVLFRTPGGELGMLDLHCTHRRASLEFGRVEDNGIRCCYHGWLYDAKGNCLDQMVEPDGGAKTRNNYKQGAYTVRELSGTIFAYIGPQPVPQLPMWDVLADENSNKFIVRRDAHSNWVQRAENQQDILHLSVLHASIYPELAGLRASRIDWNETWYGLDFYLEYPNGVRDRHHYMFPSVNRVYVSRAGQRPHQLIQWYVPIDDTFTMTYQIFCSMGDKPPYKTTVAEYQTLTPGNYKRVEDGWWGIWERDQDDAAMESQGTIADRTLEHLASSDIGVVKFRRMLSTSIDAVARGASPTFGVPPNDEVVMLETYKTLGLEDPTKIRHAGVGEKLAIRHPYDVAEDEVGQPK